VAVTRIRRVCVTGTNGKTTTTSMIDAIVAATGAPSARVTTLGAFVLGQHLSDGMTRAAFDEAVRAATAAGVEVLAIETTSKALGGGFARRHPPDVAVFTNLSRDHLDTHGTPERYLAAKAQLFLALGPTGVAVLNASDPASALLDEVAAPGVRRLAYAPRAVAPECGRLPVVLAAESVRVDRDGTSIELAASDLARRLGGELRLRVVGSVHADNALAAAVAADALGIEAAAVRAGLESFAGVPGRFEIVARRPLVAVDYAHTPDALARTLRMARGLIASWTGRVLVVFGCGGDRDRGKRPEMGRIADELADEVFLTTDNPRREDPRAIADAVFGGARPLARWVREPDRAAAIARAIEGASATDVVVIAGKGHERTQSVGGVEHPFSDVEVARAVCDRRGC
jgi:UDP-N-acetylmuramoyl-L-alanyl-D-glutamate--2,6-diaminopimelate ligase